MSHQMDYAVLELNADADHDGTRETGVFYLVGNLEINHGVDLGHLIGGSGTTVNSIVTSRTQDSPKRAGYYLDLGGGRHTFQINFMAWEGAEADLDDSGTTEQLQFGDGSGSLPADATGQDATTQAQVLQEYLRSGEFDSRAAHGKLRWGLYRDGTYHDSAGPLDDYIHVAILDSGLVRSVDKPKSVDGSILMAEAEDWRDVLDAFEEIQW